MLQRRATKELVMKTITVSRLVKLGRVSQETRAISQGSQFEQFMAILKYP
jgi:hypothetical protein